MMYELTVVFLLGFGFFLIHRQLSNIQTEIRRIREESEIDEGQDDV